MADASHIAAYGVRYPRGFAPVSLGYRTVALVAPGELPAAQVGYAVDQAGRRLSGGAAGDWSADWLVVAREDELGDPIFVDAADPAWPVYTAAHGEGAWEPERVADSLAGFVAALELVRGLAAGRETPAAREANPIPEPERVRALRHIGRANPGASLAFWESWLAED